MKDYGAELQRARTFGLGIYLNPICDICNRPKAGKSHPVCSRIRQQRTINEKNLSRM